MRTKRCSIRRNTSAPFVGRVIVKDPRFNLQADKLIVHLAKGEKKGLEKAIAEGKRRRRQERPGENGAPAVRSVGRADRAVYTAGDGNVELTGTPRVQSGLNMHVATSPDTVMLINQNGTLTTKGPSRTELRQEPKARADAETMNGRTAAVAPMATSTLKGAPPPAKPVLATEELVKIYGGRAVVNGVNINVRAGEIVGLLGPNGAGKTTSFYMIVGLVRPNSGRVMFSGTEVTGYPMYKRAPAWHGLPAAGGIDLPQADGGAEHHGDPRDAAALEAGPEKPLRRTAQPVRHRKNREEHRAHAFRR
jgi:ABC-type multidrug transport system fused ATPase/permease subunit